jgi:DNA-binding MarR family transcriptional regulator
VNGLRRIVRALHQSHRRAEQRWDLSAAQLLVLQRLAESPTLSVNELAERTFTHQSTVSVVVTRLVRRGLVRRERANDDQRRAELALTPAGRVLLQRAMTAAQTRLMDAVDAMPTSQLRAVGAGLQRLVEALGVEREPATMFFEEGVLIPQSSAAKSSTRERRTAAK